MARGKGKGKKEGRKGGGVEREKYLFIFCISRQMSSRERLAGGSGERLEEALGSSNREKN